MQEKLIYIQVCSFLETLKVLTEAKHKVFGAAVFKENFLVVQNNHIGG
jgi:hypothetical protein